jgi:hypothetical protein
MFAIQLRVWFHQLTNLCICLPGAGKVVGEIAKESNVLTPNVFEFALFSEDEDNTKST